MPVGEITADGHVRARWENDHAGPRGPTPVECSRQRSGDLGAKGLPGTAERQLGILNRSAFPDAELALGDPREETRIDTDGMDGRPC